MLQIIVSALISLGMIAGAFNYTEQHSQVKLGANSTISAFTALTSPAYDDVIAIVDSSPTPTTKKMTWAVATSSIKTDFDNIYAPKIGSTNITTLGTVTTGTWNASILSAQYGGTGSSTLSSNRLFVGNGTGAVQSIESGSSGQYLVSNGAGVAPSFQTASVDQAGTYTWTGLQSWSATTTYTGTSTRTAPLIGTYGLSVGTTTATSTGNAIITGTASTTNLIVTNNISLQNNSTMSGWASSTGYEVITSTSGLTGVNGQVTTVTPTCSSGKVVIGGGGYVLNVGASVPVLRNTAPTSTTAWVVSYLETANGAVGTIAGYAICVRN